MNQGFHLINSGDLLLIMNHQLLEWLGTSYFATLFGVGIAFWLIRYLAGLTFAPLDHQKQGSKPLVYAILGIVLWMVVALPLERFEILDELIDVEEGVTPASAFAKRVLADGSDYLTLVILLRSFGIDEPYDPLSWEPHAGQILEDATFWYTRFIGLDQVGFESGLFEDRDAGYDLENLEGVEGGMLTGMGNFLSDSFSRLQRTSLLIWTYMTDPLVLVTLFVCILMILVVGLWFTVLGYGLPFLFCFIIFCLPFSYLFDGMARLIPLIKILAAFALAKPLAMLSVALTLGVIDDYFLGIFHDGNVSHHLTTIYSFDFWSIFTAVKPTFSKPFVLGVTLTGALMAMFAPAISFVIIGSDGGGVVSMLSAAYLYVATQTAKMAGKVAISAASGGATAGDEVTDEAAEANPEQKPAEPDAPPASGSE